MKANDRPLLSFLKDQRQLTLPLYQRFYVWRHKECEDLWDAIVDAATHQETRNYFLGSIILSVEKKVSVSDLPTFQVIDGQQRLVTISLLLLALVNELKIATDAFALNADEIYMSYLRNDDIKGEGSYKMLLTPSDKDTFIDLIQNTGQIKITKRNNQLVKNYCFFKDKLNQSSFDFLTLFEGLKKFVVVECLIDREQDAQQIFETLNIGGMSLSTADVARNRIVTGSKEEQIVIYYNHWQPIKQTLGLKENIQQFDRFMYNYLAVKWGDIPDRDGVLSFFTKYFHSKSQNTSKEIVSDLLRYSNYFSKIAFLLEENKDIKSTLQDIEAVGGDIAYPLLLDMYNVYAKQEISLIDFINGLRTIEAYIFRCVVCNIPRKVLKKIFTKILQALDKYSYLQSLKVAMHAEETEGYCPDDEEFYVAFITRDMYHLSCRNYMFRKIENHNRKERIITEDYTIEHIMPQNKRLPLEWKENLGKDWESIHMQYLHTIGNLTLTGYNSELGDRSFREKRDMDGGFADSPIRLNRMLARLENWNKDEIEKRARQIANQAKEIWSLL